MFSKNIQLLNFPSKDVHQKSRPWSSSTKPTTLNRQLSNIESSQTTNIHNDSIINNKNNYQRSISIENATMDEYFKRSNRAVSVEPNLISGGNDIKYYYQQKNLPIDYDSTTNINKQFTLSSETINQTT